MVETMLARSHGPSGAAYSRRRSASVTSFAGPSGPVRIRMPHSLSRAAYGAAAG